MITITEKQINNQIGYEILDDETGEFKIISFTLHKVLHQDREYTLIYNYEMEPLEDSFLFLNYYLSDKSIHTKYKSGQAIKLLYAFEEIIDKELAKFEKNDINTLKSFLHGYSARGNHISTNLKTVRANNTINSYLSIYREYLQFLGKNNTALNRKNNTFTYFDASLEQDFSKSQYQVNEKSSNVIEVPKYISIDDFKKIIQNIRTKYTLLEEVIIRLMFEAGLRIGEVLGLTFEDLKIMEEDGDYICLLYIRNRYSDKGFQSAKSCMSVINKNQYHQKDYKLKNFGYQFVVISLDLYNAIDEYINQFHSVAMSNYAQNYYKNTIADKVSTDFIEDNYYIFINSLGNPLTQANWNKTVRKIFKENEIHVDTKERKHNLNHRFRHGFAMFQVQYMKCDEIELKERMRHKSLQSVVAYFNPTIKDQIKIRKELTQSLYDIYPNLKIERG